MQLVFEDKNYSAEVAIIFVAEGNEKHYKADQAMDTAAPWLAISPAWRDCKGKKDELVLAYGPASSPISRVLLVGLGKLDKLDELGKLKCLRNATAKAMTYCREHEFSLVATELSSLDILGVGSALTEMVSSAYLSLYRNLKFKSELKDLKPDPTQFILLSMQLSKSMQEAAQYGRIKAQAVNRARELSNSPANHLTPVEFAKQAKTFFAKPGFTCEVLDASQLQALGFGAHIAVGQGSINPSCLVIIEHTPEHVSPEAEPIVIVGKGITFDSGGISLKPSADMWEMKTDCGGATAVFGMMSALAELKISQRVIGLLALAENMPDGKAYRPGDVLTTYSGKTVEIISTDAEGRLVLCDALSYAQKRWQPKLLIDIATLTGASVVALGDYVASVFATTPELADNIKNIAAKSGEIFWPMPLSEDYMDYLKSDTADFTNAGFRSGGACTAAIFLKQFISTPSWIHLDIAGPGFISKSLPTCPAGGTGFGTMTLLDLVKSE